MANKKIYDGSVIYEFIFHKNRIFRGAVEYIGKIEIPIPNFILAFDEKNAKNIITYSNLWDNDIADYFIWNDYKVKEYKISKKYIDIKEVDTQELSLFDIIYSMRPKDFLEWFFQKND